MKVIKFTIIITSAKKFGKLKEAELFPFEGFGLLLCLEGKLLSVVVIMS